MHRGRLLALNVAVLVAFSAVTVDALTRSGRVPAQGTLGPALGHSGHKAQGKSASKSGRRTASAPSIVVAESTSGRRLVAPGVLAPRQTTTHRVRRTTGGGKQRAVQAPTRTTPGTLAPSPVDLTVAYPAVSTTVALSTALGLREAAGDTAGEARAMLRWVNDNGGIGGHPVRLKLLTYDPAEGTGFSAAFAPACAAAGAAKAKPLAVIAPLQEAEVQSSCLAKHQLTLVGDGPAAGDSEVYSRAGDSLFAPGSMSLDRIAREQASVLGAKGFLAKGSRVGIVRIDSPAFARVARTTLRDAVAQTGARVVTEAVVPRPYALTDVPTVLAAVRSAVLQLRGALVDRVIMLDSGVIAPLFMRVADRQAYRPKYGLNSTMAPAALVDQVPATQLQGAVGVGYSPALDVAEADAPSSGARTLCNDIFKGASVDLGGNGISGHYAGIALCGQLMTIRDALSGVADPTAGRLGSALQRLTAPPSVLALTSRFDAAHHDGAGSVRALAFNGDCRCMHYAGDARNVR